MVSSIKISLTDVKPPDQFLTKGLCHGRGFTAPESRRDENVDVARADVLVEVFLVRRKEIAAVGGHEEVERLACKTLGLARLRPVQDCHLKYLNILF